MGGHGVGVQALFLAQPGQEGAHVGVVGVHQGGVGAEHVARGLRGGQGLGVHEQGLGGGLLHVHHRADLSGDLGFDVVALVEHERDLGVGGQGPAAHHLVHDAEELEGVGGADPQVVVGVEARVEVEGAEFPGAQQERDDELDVGVRGVVSGVHAHHGPLAQLQAVGVGGAPVGDVGGVEGGFEELVLQQDPLVLAQPVVELAQRSGETVLAGAQVVLAGVVGAVGEPELEVARAGGVHDVDALQQVVDGLAAHAGVGVGDAAEPVVVVLEDVGVDGADGDAQVSGVGGQGGVVVHLVPGDVQGDGGGDAGVAVHLGGVGDLLPGVAGHPGLREHLEPGSGVAEGPGGKLDVLAAQDGEGVRCDHDGGLRSVGWDRGARDH